MSSHNFIPDFPRSQNDQNIYLWNPTPPPASEPSLTQQSYHASLMPNQIAAHNSRKSEYLSRTISNALGTVPLPNFNFDEKKPRRITSPLSNVKPIGFEREISHQRGYSSFSIYIVGEDVPSVEEESGDNSPIVTQSLIRGLQPIQHRASNSMQEDEISVLNIGTSVAGLSVNEGLSLSQGKKSYGTLQGYVPYAQAREKTENMGLHPSEVASRHRGITAIFRGPQAQSSLPLNSGVPYASPNNIQPLGHRSVGHQHNRSVTSCGGPGQYMSQFNKKAFDNPSKIIDEHTRKIHMLTDSFVHQNHSRVSHSLESTSGNVYVNEYPTQYGSQAAQTNYLSPSKQISNNIAYRSSQFGFRPTDQLLREQGLLAPLPAEASATSNYLSDNEDRNIPNKFGGEANLPNELNCAVWIQGIPKDFARNFLYHELFNVISIGPIIAGYICLGGDQHSHHAAKVIFKHPEHAARLFQRALFQGIYIHGNRLRVEPNRHGHREYPLRLHYRSRVILIEVFHNPGMNLTFWKTFISNMCVYNIESCRHLSGSTPERMVMEFRFARIFGQASVLLAGIRSTASFQGIVTARYTPDVPCDICDV